MKRVENNYGNVRSYIRLLDRKQNIWGALLLILLGLLLLMTAAVNAQNEKSVSSETSDGINETGTGFPDLCEGCGLPATGFSSRKAIPMSAGSEGYSYDDLKLSIQIPVLDVTADLVSIPLTDNTWPVEGLENRAGLLSGTSIPGEGYSVIAAHNILNSMENGPFALLSTLKNDDEIFVKDAEGKQIRFNVFANELLDPDDFDVMASAAEKEPGSLVLVTCENESADGRYLNRRVVFAKPASDPDPAEEKPKPVNNTRRFMCTCND